MLMGWLMRFFPFEPVPIAECFAFCSETTSLLFFWGLRWAAAQTCLGTSSPNPFSASRGFNNGFYVDGLADAVFPL